MKKFRTWISSTKTMVNDMDIIFTMPDIKPSDIIMGNTDLKLLWSTGKIDKNNQEIFDGDIIKVTNEIGNEILVVCEFGEAVRNFSPSKYDCNIVGFYYRLPDGFKSFPIVKNYLGVTDYEIFEVIGNIYENPEMLKNS